MTVLNVNVSMRREYKTLIEMCENTSDMHHLRAVIASVPYAFTGKIVTHS